MKVYNTPNSKQWAELIQRPKIDNADITKTVSEIIETVKLKGDNALKDYAVQFNATTLDALQVTEEEIYNAENAVPQKLKDAIDTAYNNIYTFHNTQFKEDKPIETTKGVLCWRKSIAIEKVGLYIPGGSAPLFSTVLMLGIPAKIAGCKHISLCTPAQKNSTIHPAILYAAKRVGCTKIFKTGGAQAIAALAFGTEIISGVYKIFGPGNQYVTKAKELVQQHGVAIDMPAGPSEVLVIANKTSNPKFVASDLLSQAEHGSDSQVILLSDNEKIIEECLNEIKIQLKNLPRKEFAEKALLNSKAIVFKTLNDCMSFSNAYAPEHLILAIDNAHKLSNTITNAGSVFLGHYSCESAGDYASGTNHTLPTNGYAKNYSGVSVDSFVKKITFQNISKEGIKNIGNTVEIMAEAEGLIAHKNAVTYRLKTLDNEN